VFYLSLEVSVSCFVVIRDWVRLFLKFLAIRASHYCACVCITIAIVCALSGASCMLGHPVGFS